MNNDIGVDCIRPPPRRRMVCGSRTGPNNFADSPLPRGG